MNNCSAYSRYGWHRRIQRCVWHRAPCFACLCALCGCIAKQPIETAEESDQQSPVPVRVFRAKQTTLHPSIDLVGMVVNIPERTASITAQIEGQIETVLVVEGVTLNKGQTLIQMDRRSYEAARIRAEAVVAQRQAALDRLKNGFLPQEIEIARQNVHQAKADLELIQLRVDATAALHENNEVSDVEFKQRQSMLHRDEAAYAAATAKLDLYLAGTRPEALAEGRAQLEVAQAELASARLAVSFCTLSSPIHGVVTQLLAGQGMNATRSDRLATVTSLTQVFVRIRVPSAYLSSVTRGARVDVNIPAVRDESFEGSIARLSGTADPNTGDMQAFALLQNEQGLLKPGLTGRVRVWLPPIEQALAVPIAALADRDGISVLHVVRDNQAYEVQVGVGASTREFVQITKGLAPDDRVITDGGYGLPEGCPVRTTSP